MIENKTHNHNLGRWQHRHRFDNADTHGERSTGKVVTLTFLMMVVEIYAGHLYGSMALPADGWHMGTHAAALGITLWAYYYAHRNSKNPAYSFGTGKVGMLGGFASAVILSIIALLMGVESVKRLITPLPIHFN